MAHFAKIENGIVTRVLVAEQSYVDTLEGEWIQTSYNTHGGVHYGQDGQPDGGIALRKNYAGVGYTYDAGRDAFIPPRPSNLFELDEATCVWKIKPEFNEIHFVVGVSESSEMPESGPEKQKILLTNVANSGVYAFVDGAFVKIEGVELVSNLQGNKNEIYRLTEGQWLLETVSP